MICRRNYSGGTGDGMDEEESKDGRELKQGGWREGGSERRAGIKDVKSEETAGRNGLGGGGEGECIRMNEEARRRGHDRGTKRDEGK